MQHHSILLAFCSVFFVTVVIVSWRTATTKVARACDLAVSVERARVVGTPPHLSGFVNSAADARRLLRTSRLRACPAAERSSTAARFNWSIVARNSSTPFRAEFVTATCELDWRAPFQGRFKVSVRVWERRSGALRACGDVEAFVRDAWVVVVGDSFASGQGSADVPQQLFGIVPAAWLSRRCHRSCKSWPFGVYERLVAANPQLAVHLTYLPCAGATIDRGLLGPQIDLPAQMFALTQIRDAWCDGVIGACQPPSPDIVLLSIGGNDIGFSEIIFSLLWGASGRHLLSVMPERLTRLGVNFKRLDQVLRNKLQVVEPKSIFMPSYYDFTGNQFGQVDANCSAMYSATTQELSLARERILQPLNGVLRTAAENWTFVSGVGELFERHGICSNESYILSMRQSIELQGDISGAFHPTAAAHDKVAQLVWTEVAAYLATAARFSRGHNDTVVSV